MIMLNYMLMLMWPMVMHGVGEPQLYPELAETKIMYVPNRGTRVCLCGVYVESRVSRAALRGCNYAVLNQHFYAPGRPTPNEPRTTQDMIVRRDDRFRVRRVYRHG